MHAELAYLFRHALLRDAAYQLQLPGDRAKLHALALEILEGPAAADILAADWDVSASRPLDGIAAELAAHAISALGCDGAMDELLMRKARRYTFRAAATAEKESLLDAYELWLRFAALNEGYTALEGRRRAGAAALMLGRVEEARQCFEAALKTDNALNKACAMISLAGLLIEERQAERAALLAQEAETLAAQCGKPSVQRGARQVKARALARTGKAQEAEKIYASMLEEARGNGDLHSESVMLGSLAGLSRDSGRMREALALHERAIELARQSNDRHGEHIEMGNLAWIWARLGDFQRAEALSNEAIAFLERAGDHRHEAMFLLSLADIYTQWGRREQARARFERLLALKQEQGDAVGEAECLCGLANLLRESGDLESSAPLYERALARAKVGRSRRTEPFVVSNLGCLLEAWGDLNNAERCYQDALTIDRELGERQAETTAIGNIAWLHALRGEFARARQMLAQALAIDAQTDFPVMQAIHACHDALCQLKLDQRAATIQWRAAQDRLRALGVAHEAKRLAKDAAMFCARHELPPIAAHQ